MCGCFKLWMLRTNLSSANHSLVFRRSGCDAVLTFDNWLCDAIIDKLLGDIRLENLVIDEHFSLRIK